jgi:hypothetical protein
VRQSNDYYALLRATKEIPADATFEERQEWFRRYVEENDWG